MPSAYWIRLGGLLPATTIGPHTAPTWETLADGGIGEVSFAMALSSKAQHQLLNAGVKVEVMLGATPVATATMSEPDRTEWQVKASGLSAQANRVAALNGLGVFTRDVGQVLLNVTTNGQWKVKLPGPIAGPGIVSGDSVDPQMVTDLLNAYAMQTGQRWGVDGQGKVYLRTDPTTPTYTLAPGAAAFGVTDEGRATQLILRYQTAGGAYATTLYPVTTPAVVIHEVIDLTARGELTAAQAQAIGAGAMARGKSQNGWTNGVTLGREQITRNGVPASLPLVTAGLMVRSTGMPAALLTAAPWLDVVIGKTRYTAGEETIYLEPVNASPVAGGLAGIIAAA